MEEDNQGPGRESQMNYRKSGESHPQGFPIPLQIQEGRKGTGKGTMKKEGVRGDQTTLQHQGEQRSPDRAQRSSIHLHMATTWSTMSSSSETITNSLQAFAKT